MAESGVFAGNYQEVRRFWGGLAGRNALLRPSFEQQFEVAATLVFGQVELGG